MKKKKEQTPTKSELILYQTEDGHTHIEVRLQDETVWMSQLAMAELFQTTIPNVSMHLRNVYAEGELQASQKLGEAAAIIQKNPIALQLRYLQTLTEIASENNSTTVFPFPIDLLTPFIEAYKSKK